MPKRSPILGFNHNVRHRGVVFHVQTEDSGVDNPHLFSHLFHGGVILSTRRLDYDADAGEDVVRGLMQSQHKALLKALRGGTLDDKIDLYLGDHPDLLAAGDPSAAAPGGAGLSEPTLRDATVPSMLAMTAEVATPLAQENSGPVEVLSGPIEIIEENSDVTIRVEALPGAIGRDTIETRRVPPPPPTSPPAVTPPASASRTIGLGSAMMGGPPAAPGPRATAPPVPGPAGDRPAPGTVEFRPRESTQPTAKVEFRKPTRGSESEVSAAFRAIRDPAAGAASSGGRDASVYIHAPRSGRSSLGPEAEGGDAPPRQERVPPAAPVAARPNVIVGAPPKVVGVAGAAAPRPADPLKAPSRRGRDSAKPNLFGKEMVSEKSLDEVILAYLSEDAEK